MVKIDTLVQDIYGLLQGKTLADPKVLERFGPELGEVLAKKFADKQAERTPTLRMSNIGRPNRQLWYELNGYKGEEINGKTYMKFLYGDLIESLVLVLAEAAGHRVERLQERIEVDGIIGHIDAVIDGVLVDIKSSSPFGFTKFSNNTLLDEGNDPFGYVKQLQGYAQALKLPAAWVAVNKISGEICVLDLPQEGINEYDLSTYISLVRAACSQSEPPAKCYEDEPYQKSGNLKLSIGCSYCSHKFECHKDANDGRGLRVFQYSTGPIFLTKVVKEPTAFEHNKKEN